MPQAPSPISRAGALMGSLFGRKPKPPPVADRADMTALQAWPWFPLYDKAAEPFGPLTPSAAPQTQGTWQLIPGPAGLRVCGNTKPESAVTIGGSIRERLPGLRITADIDIGHLTGEDALAGLVFAAAGDARAIMALLGTGMILVFVLDAGEAKILHQADLPPRPPGQAADLTLQAMLFGDEAVLFANGAFIGTATDAGLIGQSAGTALQVKGDTDMTLRSLTVDGLKPARANA